MSLESLRRMAAYNKKIDDMAQKEETHQLIQLQPRDNEYMGILQEECAEVIQVISKIFRFGLYSSNPYEDNAKNNQQQLIDEVGDVYALIQKLEDRGLFTREQIEARAKYKHEKLKRYLRTEE